jgi:hypothetical protein
MRIGWQIADLSLSLGMLERQRAGTDTGEIRRTLRECFFGGRKNSPSKSCLSGETVLPLYQIKVYENSIHARIHRIPRLGG